MSSYGLQSGATSRLQLAPEDIVACSTEVGGIRGGGGGWQENEL
jgi:hypothetical protein